MLLGDRSKDGAPRKPPPPPTQDVVSLGFRVWGHRTTLTQLALIVGFRPVRITIKKTMLHAGFRAGVYRAASSSYSGTCMLQALRCKP